LEDRQSEVPSGVPARYKYSRLAQGRPPPPPFAHVAPMIGLPVKARLGRETGRAAVLLRLSRLIRDDTVRSVFTREGAGLTGENGPLTSEPAARAR
jgi:hypothetical protein